MSRILLITTGGTIGALPVKDVMHMPYIKEMPTGEDIVKTTLATFFPALETRCVTLEARDSNFIDGPYRENIAQTIERSNETRVLITHGTDTLLETAQFLYDKAQLHQELYREKAIVLTGAIVPLTNGPLSDGFRNLAFSLEQLAGATTPFLGIVLSGYDTLEPRQGEWRPQLYRYEPKKYRKFSDKNDPTKDRLMGLEHGASCAKEDL